MSNAPATWLAFRETMEDAIAPDDREAFHRGLMNLAERVDRLPNGSFKTQQD